MRVFEKVLFYSLCGLQAEEALHPPGHPSWKEGAEGPAKAPKIIVYRLSFFPTAAPGADKDHTTTVAWRLREASALLISSFNLIMFPLGFSSSLH
jgi:hypothetical protein